MNDLMTQALQILLIGMGTVLSFLILLVFVMKAVGIVVPALERFSPQKTTAAVPAQASDDSMVAAAIAVALSK